LQAAIDAAHPGDTLLVAPGVYDKIAVSKSLSLVGDGAVIRAGSREACVIVEADGVSISGFLVRDGLYGILLKDVRGCTVSNNTVIGCAQPGIALLNTNESIIQHNNASFNGLGGEGWYGIWLSRSSNNRIIGNTASDNGEYGIPLFPYCTNNTLVGNVMERNDYGIYMFTNCSGNVIEGNNLVKNRYAGLEMRLNCHDNLVLNNTISRNGVVGISLTDSGQNAIEGNEIAGNLRWGVQIQEQRAGRSDGNIISKNGISESQTGLFVESSRNLVYGNRIFDNVLQAEDRGKNSWNASYPLGGNMWGDYLGEDRMGGPEQRLAGADGFGDAPYKINDRAEDIYPVMGVQVRQIEVLDKSISPLSARVGDPVKIRARLSSRRELGQVSVRAASPRGVEAGGYVRMVLFGDLYQGTLATALMEPGMYDIVLSARDVRGYELKEKLGELELGPRGS
jgi:parallel beta-helix repeat protein